MAGKTVRERIIDIMTSEKGRSFSGQELADSLGVTRAAVWKAIETLRAQGYHIEGTTNKGYSFSPDNDVIDASNICSVLNEEALLFYTVECMTTTPSTNLEVKDRAAFGAPEGLCIIAEEQTKGRGRMGRSFHSPKGSGIYLSVLLRPQFSAEEAVQITVAAAAAAACAVEKACPALPKDSIRIKWVNDLFLNDRKIAGILTEASISVENTSLEYAVLGIGFNVCTPEGGWPEDIEKTAGGLDDYEIPSAARVQIAAQFLNCFLPYYRELTAHTHLAEYRKRQLLTGSAIDIVKPDGSLTAATALDVDDSCRLIARLTETGEVVHLSSGEVRVRKA